MAFSSQLFSKLPLVGIVRGLPAEKLAPLVSAVRDGGLANLEVTMNTPGAAEQIRAAVGLAGSVLNIGAGTVTTLPLLDAALEAGATFIVTPVVVEPVIRRCVELKVPVFPGALTPTEILRAWDLGATMVKVFPADVFGPGYIRSVKAPCPQVKLMPTGGVNLATLTDYAAAGADAFGLGSPLFNKERLAANDWPWLRSQVQAFAQAYRAARS